MIIQRLVVLLFLFILANANPTYQSARQNEDRQRRSLEITNGQLHNMLHKHLFQDDNHRADIGNRVKRSDIRLVLRPLDGPINIEQLPAALAARFVQRYPYSQKDDPDIIGR